MDTTQIEELLTKLESADPADAPDVADDVADRLAENLDSGQPAAPDTEPGGDH